VRRGIGQRRSWLGEPGNNGGNAYFLERSLPPRTTWSVGTPSHPDIGVTDDQDLCYRQPRLLSDQALDLIDATQTDPAAAHYHWVWDVTGMTANDCARASSAQVERGARQGVAEPGFTALIAALRR
jgi:hypothetical protein